MTATQTTTKPTPYPFPILVFDEVPVEPPRSTQQALPFRPQWTALAIEVEKDGKARGFYVPASYFIEERGAVAEKVTGGYIKQKLSDEWRKWIAEAPAAKRGERFVLVRTSRTGIDDGYESQGPGVIAALVAKP